MNIIIIYHSGYGHTKMVAEHIKMGINQITEDVLMYSTNEAKEKH